jgi:hypothetical protein
LVACRSAAQYIQQSKSAAFLHTFFGESKPERFS